MADHIDLAPTVVSASPAAQHTDTELLDALRAAHEAGDDNAAMEIAQQLSAQSVTHEPQPGNTSGSAHQEPSTAESLLRTYGNAVAGPVETAMHVGSGLLAGPVAGYAGMGAAAAHALGAHVDPADVVRKVGSAMTYDPRTQGGKDTTDALESVTGLIPKAGDDLGEYVSDKTHSPALGALANTALQGTGMIVSGEALPAGAGALRRSAPVQRVANLASDYLPGGANRATTRIINKYAADTPGGPVSAREAIEAHLKAEADLRQAGQSGALADKYGIHPTAPQVSGSPGLAQLGRTVRNQGDGVPGPLNDADAVNRGAVVNILKKISGSPESRTALQNLRDKASDANYTQATTNPEHAGVQPPSPEAATFAEELEKNRSRLPDPDPNAPNATVGLNAPGARLQSLMQRPAFIDAMNNATRQAANRGVRIDNSNLIQQLHYSKMHLDGEINKAVRSGDKTELGGLMDTKKELTGIMDAVSPEYAAARQKHIELSGPINRANVGEALRQKYLSALQESSGTGSRPSMLLDALRKDDGDAIARQATDFSGATLENTLHPEDIASLDAARQQLGREAFEQNAGRSVGSPTAQNRSSQGAIDSVGDLSSVTGHLGELAAAVHNPLVSLPLGIRGAGVRAATKTKLAQTLADPAETLRALKADGLTTGIPGPVIKAAQAQGSVDPSQYADGGPVDSHGNAITKPSFWDLVQTAIHEITTPDDDSPSAAPLGSGAAAGAAHQLQAAPRRMMDVADAQS